jgi:hypothetical protein
MNRDFTVQNTDYIRTENNPNEGDSTPTEPVNPQQPEAE